MIESVPEVPGVTPEVELLLCCSRARLDERHRECIARLAPQVTDWGRLIRESQRHGVGPLLASHLDAFPDAAIPDPVRTKLRNLASACQWRNFDLSEELLTVLGHFEEHGIRAVPMKGPVLAETLYGDASLRLCNDLDIIVPKSAVPKAIQVLISHDFMPEGKAADLQKPTYGDADATERCATLIRRTYNHNFVREKGNVAIELHWGIAPPTLFRADIGFVWDRLVALPFHGRSALGFAPEDLILTLSVHATKHWWNRLVWICDIAEFVRTHRDMDWEAAAAHAERVGCRRMMLVGLQLAESLTGAEIPECIGRLAAADPLSGVLARRIQNGLFTERGFALDAGQEVRFLYQMKESVPDRMRYIASTIRHEVRSRLTRR